jgi:hypothetical protein
MADAKRAGGVVFGRSAEIIDAAPSDGTYVDPRVSNGGRAVGEKRLR